MCSEGTSRSRPPCRREACLLRRAAVVRRASCGLQRQASAACLARRRRACALCLRGGGSVRKLAACARRAALDMVGLRPIEGRSPGSRPLSFDARPWRDAPAAASNTKPAPHVSPAYLARMRARDHQGGGPAFKLAMRAPCCVDLDWLTHFRRALRRREAPLLRRSVLLKCISQSKAMQQGARTVKKNAEPSLS